MEMTRLDRSLWFISRATIAVLFVPNFQNKLFVPFLSVSTGRLWDPWQIWLDSGGRTDAFPYGPVMFLFLGSLACLAKGINTVFSFISLEVAIQIRVSATALVLEYFILRITWPKGIKGGSLRILYLAAPLPIYITFIHGQIDIVPAFLLLLAVVHSQKQHWFYAGLLLGASVSTKFSMALTLPIFLVYFLHGRVKIDQAKKFLYGFLPIAALVFMPAIWSSSYVTMVLKTPEVGRSLDFYLQLGQQNLYLLPVGYFVFLFLFWSLPRVTTAILGTFIAISLISVASFQTGSVGWYYWGLPLLPPLLSNSRSRLVALFLLWQVSITGFYAYNNREIQFRFMDDLKWSANSTVSYMLFTIMLVSGFALLTRLIVEMDSYHDPYNLRKHPISIAIAGDSGAGKDTLTNAISSLIGAEQVSILLGDDYHMAERGDLVWRKVTPLNPGANDLLTWNQDLLKTLSRKKTFARHYDHANGHFTPLRSIVPNDFVLSNGLHALTLPIASEMDLRIFLSMDEELRLKLKLERDIQKRGHSASPKLKQGIKLRKKDSDKFISGQRNLADLVIHTTWTEGDLESIRHSIYSPNRVLIAELYRLLSAAAPDFVILEIDDENSDLLLIDPSGFNEQVIKLAFNRSIDKANHLILEPNFQILDSTVLGLVCMIVASRNRLLRYV